MGMKEHALPFPRGQTMGDGVLTLTDTYRDSLEGRLFTVPDTVNATGMEVTLRVVKNDTGSAITVARDLCQFSVATAKDFGRRIDSHGSACTAGDISKPMDDAYTVAQSIPDDDLFYVVDEGPCQIRTESSSCSLTAQDAVAADGDGRINGAAAAAGEAVVGVIDATTAEESTAVLVYVTGGLTNANA